MTARSRLGSSVSAGTRYGTPASRILRLARTKRWAIVESGTRNARAISGRLQPAEQPQRQGDLRLGGQRRMTAGEDQPQPVVLHGSLLRLVVAGRAPARAGTAREGRCEAARALQQRVLAARRLSAVHVAALVRVFLAAGWSVSDLAYALDHAPDGAAHWHTAPVHSPAGWLRARLGWWTDAAGAVRPSHTAQLAAGAAAHRRRLAGQQAAAEAAAGAAATPAA